MGAVETDQCDPRNVLSSIEEAHQETANYGYIPENLYVRDGLPVRVLVPGQQPPGKYEIETEEKEGRPDKPVQLLGSAIGLLDKTFEDVDEEEENECTG